MPRSMTSDAAKHRIILQAWEWSGFKFPVGEIVLIADRDKTLPIYPMRDVGTAAVYAIAEYCKRYCGTARHGGAAGYDIHVDQD